MAVGLKIAMTVHKRAILAKPMLQASHACASCVLACIMNVYAITNMALRVGSYIHANHTMAQKLLYRKKHTADPMLMQEVSILHTCSGCTPPSPLGHSLRQLVKALQNQCHPSHSLIEGHQGHVS